MGTCARVRSPQVRLAATRVRSGNSEKVHLPRIRCFERTSRSDPRQHVVTGSRLRSATFGHGDPPHSVLLKRAMGQLLPSCFTLHLELSLARHHPDKLDSMAASVVVALAAFSTVGTATLSFPPSYGRFPCSVWGPDNQILGDDSLCAHDKLLATGPPLSAVSGHHGFKRNGAVPSGSTCAQDETSGSWWCGIAGAACTSDAACDNGICTAGVCTGGYDYVANNNNSLCSGYLWSTLFDGLPFGDGTCGGLDAYCQDGDQSELSRVPEEERWDHFDQNCASGYCNSLTASCAVKCNTAGCDCTSDPKHRCGKGLKPVIDKHGWCTCQPIHPSKRARARRRLELVDERCPKSLTACTIGNGYECVDTQTDLEQCGACADSGGVDCTQTPGVASAACFEGSCVIWACEDGLEYDPLRRACLTAH